MNIDELIQLRNNLSTKKYACIDPFKFSHSKIKEVSDLNEYIEDEKSFLPKEEIEKKVDTERAVNFIESAIEKYIRSICEKGVKFDYIELKVSGYLIYEQSYIFKCNKYQERWQEIMLENSYIQYMKCKEKEIEEKKSKSQELSPEELYIMNGSMYFSTWLWEVVIPRERKKIELEILKSELEKEYLEFIDNRKKDKISFYNWLKNEKIPRSKGSFNENNMKIILERTLPEHIVLSYKKNAFIPKVEERVNYTLNPLYKLAEKIGNSKIGYDEIKNKDHSFLLDPSDILDDVIVLKFDRNITAHEGIFKQYNLKNNISDEKITNNENELYIYVKYSDFVNLLNKLGYFVSLSTFESAKKQLIFNPEILYPRRIPGDRNIITICADLNKEKKHTL